MSISCQYCCGPKVVETGCLNKESLSVVQLHHISMYHLGVYKPFSCIQCNGKWTTERSFKHHSIINHPNQVVEPVVKTSNYLDVLGRVMMQSNSSKAFNQQQSVSQLVDSIKENTPTLPIASDGSQDPQTPNESPRSSNTAQQVKYVLKPVDPGTEIFVKQGDRLIRCLYAGPSVPIATTSKQVENVSSACHHCGKVPSEQELAMQEHFHCQHCDFVSVSRHGLRIHMSRLHTELQLCGCCDKVFTCSEQLKRHLVADHKRSLCQGCNETFKKLSRHKCGQSGETDFAQCKTCNKGFRRLADLHNHERMHKGEEGFKCNRCKKRFAWPSEFKKHKCKRT